MKKNTKFIVRPKLCHLTQSRRSSAPKACELSQIWHNFGRMLNLVCLSISWIFISSVNGATSYLSVMDYTSRTWILSSTWVSLINSLIFVLWHTSPVSFVILFAIREGLLAIIIHMNNGHLQASFPTLVCWFWDNHSGKLVNCEAIIRNIDLAALSYAIQELI